MNYPCSLTAPITQQFGVNPRDYKRFGLAGHNGLDFALIIGSPVYAACSGVITKIGSDPQGYGKYIIIDHDAVHMGVTTLYAHLTYPTVRVGQQVSTGAVIAYSGNTGNSTGPHLHFEIRDKARSFNGYRGAVDPIPYLHDTIPAAPAPQQDAQSVSYLALVMETLNVRSKPSTIDGLLIGKLPAGLVILVQSTIPAGADLWAKIGPGMFSAVLYNGSTFLERISQEE